MKTLEVDDLGVRLFIGSKKEWDIPWSAIDSVGSSSVPGRYPRVGFSIVSAGKGHSVNDRDQMGNRNELEQAFEIIVRKATTYNIDINDTLGWATDVLPTDYIEYKQRLFAHGKEKWHDTGQRGAFDNVFLYFILSFLVVGVGILILLPGSEFQIWGYMLLVQPMIFLPIILLIYLSSIASIWFDDTGIVLRFPRGNDKVIRWGDIKNIGANPRTGYIGISTFSGKGWAGFKFQEDVCEAIQVHFSAFEKRRKSAPGRGKW